MYLTVRDPRRDRLLQRFAELCIASSPADQAMRLREALELARANRSAEIIEVMIAAGAYESAALAVIGTEATWMASRGGAGRCLASIVLPGMTEDVSAEGTTPALALLAAWAKAALVNVSRQGADLALAERPAGTLLH